MPRISVFGFYAVERWGVQQSEIVITCRFTQPDEPAPLVLSIALAVKRATLLLRSIALKNISKLHGR
jgi:hypothetical protein